MFHNKKIIFLTTNIFKFLLIKKGSFFSKLYKKNDDMVPKKIVLILGRSRDHVDDGIQKKRIL
jgi:hypothetical protein